MNREREDYFESLNLMFTHKGWETFVKDMEKYREKAEEEMVKTVINVEGLMYRRGRVELLRFLENYKEYVDTIFKYEKEEEEFMKGEDDDEDL